MTQTDRPRLQAVVLGVSAGGVLALKTLLTKLPADFPLPILIVQHLSPEVGSMLANLLDAECKLRVKEGDECEAVQAGTVYLAPPNYHMLIERDRTLVLSTDAPVRFARPSIDVLFESAARAYGANLVGVILTGANADGSEGLKTIKAHGGVVVIQDPDDAEVDVMPVAALAALGEFTADHVVPLAEIAALLQKLAGKPAQAHPKSRSGRARSHHAGH